MELYSTGAARELDWQGARTCPERHINAAYQSGKASTGAEKIDNNAVYVDGKIAEYKQI